MIKRKLTRNPEKMTKSEVVEYFKENILPYVREKYESDRIIDTPARREAWNDMVDFLIKDGSVSKSAEDWGLPSQFERKERKNPFADYRKKKREPIRKVDLDVGDLFRFYHGECGDYKCKSKCSEWSDHRYRIEPVLNIRYDHDHGLVRVDTESAIKFIYPYEAVKWE